MKKTMILASGLQSGGTTLVSSCFLKHPDLDGVLDMASDRIEVNLSRVSTSLTWVKMTTVAFSWQEVAEVYAIEGFEVYPLLIVRNPFDAWASLKNKWYGLNSTTAEDPPLFLRFRRFLHDWQFFMQKGYPIIQFESFISNPEQALKRACKSLPIEFHSGMLEKDTDLSGIAYVTESNASFVDSLNKGISNQIATRARSIDETEYAWILENMHELLAYYQYENSHNVVPASPNQGLAPQPFDSRRYLGFGPRASDRKVSRQLSSLIVTCQRALTAGKPLYIYGACELGEYLHGVLHSENIPVTGFVDSYSDIGRKFCGLEVSQFDSSRHCDSVFIVASFHHATTIRELLNLHMPDDAIFTF